MIFRKLAGAAATFAMLATSAAQAQNFNGTSFEINRERVRLGTIKTCAKNETYLVPTAYLYVTIRNSLSAGGGLGAAKAKARVYIDGLRKSELQGLAANIQDQIVTQLRAAGYKVLTYDDVKSDVADKERMKPNPRYSIATHDSRAFPGMDFAVASPTDEQTLDYGLLGPQANFGKAAQRTGATLLLPEVYITLPQLGAQANKTQTLTWRSSSASISFDPAMHMAGANVYGSTAKGGWCSILVPEHGGRVPALVAGEFKELSVSEEKLGDDWSTRRGDYSFVVDNAAFDTGVNTVSKTLAHLVVDSMNGVK